MLATLVGEAFSDSGWIYERKLDGERCLAYATGPDVRLYSRNGKKLNDTYPEIEEALVSSRENDYIVDGEIVAFRQGLTSFSRLQSRMQVRDREEARRLSRKVAVFYYVFDLLYVDGWDLSRVPLRQRKAVLRKVITFRGRVRYTPHRNGDGETFFREACRKEWEGVIAKKANGAYRHSRSREWLKFKCVRRQEFVVGGYSSPGGRREGFGAILVGYYSGDDLVYAGKVGTGFDRETLRDLKGRFDSMKRRTSPFDSGSPRGKGVTWISPQLVAEIGFTEWTGNGKLRHPRYLGLRRDKGAGEVVREQPEG
jgi:bifunctional non-homologous end joining protein LigD